ncbi:DISARM system phospholipase D-like protein DrmC [Nonomuraea sediminis]|uniref:DISARM system phospholipase D-like protein DrmC n=1 Tax=Nonomuraea sediminis TaxID=2835864 RepID=UPI001BDDB182|nr:DISARM system phospholipase D-like protein DrmC [Nonomuraea sediminis]
MTPELHAAVVAAAEEIGPGHLRTLASLLTNGDSAVEHAVATLAYRHAARRVLDALGDTERAEAAAFARGVAAGYEAHRARSSVDPVWSGPDSPSVPVRATAQALVELVAGAAHELILMTYSAKPYKPLINALSTATRRGVSMMAVVETLQGAGSALAGAEPYAAFTNVPGLELWHWPTSRRAEQGAKMHAKLAVADRAALLVSSANLTQSGVTSNIEAGLLVRGGAAPQRAAEHITALRDRGVLERLR